MKNLTIHRIINSKPASIKLHGRHIAEAIKLNAVKLKTSK